MAELTEQQVKEVKQIIAEAARTLSLSDRQVAQIKEMSSTSSLSDRQIEEVVRRIDRLTPGQKWEVGKLVFTIFLGLAIIGGALGLAGYAAAESAAQLEHAKGSVQQIGDATLHDNMPPHVALHFCEKATAGLLGKGPDLSTEAQLREVSSVGRDGPLSL